MVGSALHFWPSVNIDFAIQAREQKYHCAEDDRNDPVFMLVQGQFFPLRKMKQIFDFRKENEEMSVMTSVRVTSKKRKKKETLATLKIAYFPTI